MDQAWISQPADPQLAALRARGQCRGDALRIDLAQLRATTPSAGRQLNVAALIRAGRDGR